VSAVPEDIVIGGRTTILILPDMRIFGNCVKPLREKYFSLSEDRIRPMFATSRAHQEGRFAIVTNVGRGMRWTRAGIN
jgi:hypothetical protein